VIDYTPISELQNAIDTTRGVIYLPPGDHVLPPLHINRSGIELKGAGSDTGRSAWGVWPTRLISDIEVDSEKTGDIRGVKLTDLVFEGHLQINENASAGRLTNVVVRNGSVVQEYGSTDWLYDNVELFNIDGIGVDLKASNHRTVFLNCKSSTTNNIPGKAVVRIGKEGHCSNVNFNTCAFQHKNLDYQINAHSVRALNISGGYMEAVKKEKAFVKLGKVLGGSVSGMYFQGNDKMPIVFDIEDSESISITGNHFRNLTQAIIVNPNGCPNSSYRNSSNTQDFNNPTSARGFDAFDFVEIKIFSDQTITIPCEPERFQMFALDGISQKSDSENIYITNNTGSLKRIVYKLNSPCGKDL